MLRWYKKKIEWILKAPPEEFPEIFELYRMVIKLIATGQLPLDEFLEVFGFYLKLDNQGDWATKDWRFGKKWNPKGLQYLIMRSWETRVIIYTSEEDMFLYPLFDGISPSIGFGINFLGREDFYKLLKENSLIRPDQHKVELQRLVLQYA